jgi:hypothetical protein
VPWEDKLDTIAKLIAAAILKPTLLNLGGSLQFPIDDAASLWAGKREPGTPVAAGSCALSAALPG